MTAPTEIRKKALALVEQLPPERLTKALEFLEALCRETSTPSEAIPIASQEEALLQIIHRQLLLDDEARLAYLDQRNETGEITEKEYHELLAYVDRVECQDTERVEAMIELARLRKVELKTLLNEFIPVNNKPDAI